MLKLKYLFENYALAKEALRYWEHDTDTVDEKIRHFRISSNAIYPFEANRQLCYLRLAPTEEKLEQNILGELEFIQYLRKQNYPALEPIASKTGAMCMKLHTEWGDYYASAFRKVNGIAIENLVITDAVMYHYGKAMGKLHSLSAEFKPHIKKWTFTEVFDWIDITLKTYGAPHFMLEEKLSLCEEFAHLPQTPENFGLVHYDFELDNVFYDETTQQCEVIDFDDAMYHWYALDIEQVFDSLAEKIKGEELKKVQREFLRGYREEHCYTEEMEQSRQLMRRFVNLYAYTRLIRSIAETFDQEPDWLIRLREKLNRVILSKEKTVLDAKQERRF